MSPSGAELLPTGIKFLGICFPLPLPFRGTSRREVPEKSYQFPFPCRGNCFGDCNVRDGNSLLYSLVRWVATPPAP
eukprot:4226587-Amphidinium_carterae.1